jgi:hypothetical protein
MQITTALYAAEQKIICGDREYNAYSVIPNSQFARNNSSSKKKKYCSPLQSTSGLSSEILL